MRSRLAASAAPILFLLLGACSATSPEGPDGEPYVRGPIESISHGATASNLLVRGGPGSREPCGISATVDARTRYLRRSASGAILPGALSQLEVGDTVEVHVDGPVAESCPVQGRASAIVLVEGGAG